MSFGSLRLPGIPEPHRRLVRSIVTVGTSALALVRRRDFTPEHETAARFGNALASADVAWLAGTQAFAGEAGDEFDLGAAFGPFSQGAGQPVRYSTDDHAAEEDTGARTQSVLNAATAAASGLVSWALWNSSQSIADYIDARLPAGVGRGLGAIASGSIVALSAAVIDRVEAARSLEEMDFAPVEIELPEHIRAAVERLLAQPHPASADTAEAVREQFTSARFFVWVTYSSDLHSDNGLVSLEPEQLAQLLADEEITCIEVYPESACAHVIPAAQTYPVIGLSTESAMPPRELSLDIVGGHLRRLYFDVSESDPAPTHAEDLPRESTPGTLHPDGLDLANGLFGEFSGFGADDDDCDEEHLTLGRWPGPEELSFRTDRE